MKNKIVKIILTLTLIFMFGLTLNIKTNAAEPDAVDSTGQNKMYIQSEEVNNQNGLYYSHIIANFKENGVTSKDQNINYFNMKTDGVNSKLVTWVKQANNSQMSNSKLTALAEDYEKNHPGWIVMAGINADQWYYETTQSNNKGGSFYYKNQSYYPLTVDGQNLFTINPLGGIGNGIAITNNPSNPIVDIIGTNPAVIELQIYDVNDKLVKTFPVTGYNQTPGSNQTMVWSGYYSSKDKGEYVDRTVNSSNNLYIIEKAELAYMNNTRDYAEAAVGTYAAIDSFYGSGIISNIANNATLSKGQFAIETTNSELISLLNKDVKVIVEQQYQQAIGNQVESVTGYHTCHVKNGVYNKVEGGYNTKNYPRSIFGVKEDGSYFLLTGSQQVLNKDGGLNNLNVDAVLNYYGAYTAYQDDGGGSVTAIYRNNAGGFDIVNESSEGIGQRSILSGLFFVVRDSGFTSYKKDSTSTSVTFNKKLNVGLDNIENISINVNGNIVNATNNQTQVVVDGLEPNKKYEAIIKYTQNGIEYTTKLDCETKAYDPGINIISNSTGFTIKRYNGDPVLKTIGVTFDIDGQFTYIMGNQDTFEISDLYLDTTYTISYICDVMDITNNKVYKVSVEAKDYKTLSYYIPKILEFEEGRKTKDSLRIKYEIEDDSELIKNIYLCVNEQKIELNNKRGTYTIEDLDFTKTGYIIKIEVIYEIDLYETTIYSQELNYQKEEHIHTIVTDEAVDPTCDKRGLTEGSRCSVCNEIIKAQEEIKPLGHSWKEATKQEPKTCTICGKTEGTKLKGCKKASIASIVLSVNLLSGVFILLKKHR